MDLATNEVYVVVPGGSVLSASRVVGGPDEAARDGACVEPEPRS